MMNIVTSPAVEPARPKAPEPSSKDSRDAPGKFDDALSKTSSRVQDRSDDKPAQPPAADGTNTPQEPDAGKEWHGKDNAKDPLVPEELDAHAKPARGAKPGKAGASASGAVRAGHVDAEEAPAKDGKVRVTDGEDTLLDLVKNATSDEDLAKALADVEADPTVTDVPVEAVAQDVTDSSDALLILAAISGPPKTAPEKGTASGRNDTQASRKVDAREKTATDSAEALPGDDHQATLAGKAPVQDSAFRFVSNRSGASGVDMRIDGARNSAEFRTSSGGSNGAENVMVLDSRRFMGLAPSSNGASLAGLITSDSEWTSALQPGAALSNAAAQSSTGNVVHTLKLQLNPIDLGSVTMSLRLSGDDLVVHLTVETRAAYRQLSEDSRGIVDVLRAQGYTVDQVSVSIAANDRSGNTQAGGQQQTGAGGQQAAEGQNRDGGAREGSGGNSNNSDAGVSDERVRSSTAAGAGNGDTAGGIYL